MENFKPQNYKIELENIFSLIQASTNWRTDTLQTILKKYPKDGNKLFRHDELVNGYEYLGLKDKTVEERIRLKPTRTNSGVATVTVLSKPYPCPGRCIFCPNDPRMPKSYIASEPGAQRALSNHFDPYAQVYNRLIALKNIGHNIEKVELLVLGGSWSAYDAWLYQIPFVTACYMALNDVNQNTTSYVKPKESLPEYTFADLEKAQKQNETAYCRNVGLVFETRPDLITKEEVLRLRKLGATKIQIGIQSLDDHIVEANNIGRRTKSVREAIRLLRLAGFKIHGHWMPNLYMSNVRKDINDYKKLWKKDFCPDELKIYPTSIVPNTLLFKLYEEGKYKPYTEDELLRVLSETMPTTPRYCRLSRIIRDIPSEEIVAGNKKTNLRQIAEELIEKKGKKMNDIRSREIKNESVSWENLVLETIKYDTSSGKEFFLSYKTKDTDKICGFLRLSIPNTKERKNNFVEELRDSSIIREVHVYGRVMSLDIDSSGESQHLGLGKKLIEMAEMITKKEGIQRISVISAIGTREYYKKRGFEMGRLYMGKEI
ncbi:tRNA uridine(34) 5-carboxymethylaminomethyl modification radical SAM/GNAT enzyme Elp3 [Patescibacteria group bacterium]|nr:tRNA uridine(34) 5-carboxymethylaminomethyl modification radical SAM/GNAT enzyme Elp3 [Patescibacteria group bacterium]